MQRAPQRAAAAEDRRAAEHHRGDGVELVAGAGVRFRLTEMRDVHDGREAGRQARQHVDQPEASRHRHAGVARAGGAEADRVERAPDDRPVQQDRVAGEHDQEDRQAAPE